MSLLLIALALAGPHADQVEQFAGQDIVAQRPLPALLPDVTPGPDRMVYGYEAYWNADLNTVPWDDLSHLAVFSSGVTTSGNLTETSRFDRAIDAVAIGAAYGVKVHLVVTNFTTSELTTLLSSPSARSTLIGELVDEVARTGAHGVNIDFESMPSSQRANMVTFVRDLDAAVDEVVLATPAVDWSGAWDYAALAEHSHLFIMGYGYHWSGSDYAGPVDPLFGGGIWSAYSLDWTAQDYLAKGAAADKVILGMPLYGNKWPVSSTGVPAPTTGRGSAVIFSTAWANGAANSEGYDATSLSHYYNLGGEQAWYGDTQTVQERIQYADTEGLGGFGFWALHYTGNDTEFWGMVHDETHMLTDDDPSDPGSEGGEDDAGLVANAGRPFLAYVGDTAVIGSENSRIPETGVTYEWTQVSGPTVGLANPETAEVSFVVTEPGVVALELVVGDGTNISRPDPTYVVVLDRDIGAAYRGCQTIPAPLSASLLLGALALGLRRRR